MVICLYACVSCWYLIIPTAPQTLGLDYPRCNNTNTYIEWIIGYKQDTINHTVFTGGGQTTFLEICPVVVRSLCGWYLTPILWRFDFSADIASLHPGSFVLDPHQDQTSGSYYHDSWEINNIHQFYYSSSDFQPVWVCFLKSSFSAQFLNYFNYFPNSIY